MQVVILCGGKGERLREHTELIPKPLIEIGGKPILWHIMKIYSHCKFNDFILCLGYKGEKIVQYFKENNKEGWDINFVDTGLGTNTGGRVKKIEKFVKGDNFLATYGDAVSDINIKHLAEFHKKHGRTATVTCTNFRSNFGIVNIGDNNLVKDFNEKPFMDMWINGGFFVFKNDVFGYLKENCILEREPMGALTKDKQLVAYKYKGFWECMDTYKDTKMLNEAYKNRKAKWMVWDKNVKA